MNGNMTKVVHDASLHGAEPRRPEKRRRIDDGRINDFFTRQNDGYGTEDEPADFEDVPSAQRQAAMLSDATRDDSGDEALPLTEYTKVGKIDGLSSSSPAAYEGSSDQPESQLQQPTIEKFFCSRCQRSLPKEQRNEHEDWHFARELLQQDHVVSSTAAAAVAARPPSRPPIPDKHKTSRGRGRPPSATGKSVEKGQRRLAFGN